MRVTIRGIILFFVLEFAFVFNSCTPKGQFNVIDFEKERVLTQANAFMQMPTQTLTSFVCERSSGGKHDFYSEGDYWWPDPANPDGPYIRKDGLSNPDNFVAHRLAMQDFSIQMPALVAAYLISHEKSYAYKAMDHLRAWFITDSTRMNPNLLYSQAIKGRVTGRGIGIIDTIHLIEIAKAFEKLRESGIAKPTEVAAIEKWFSDYTYWLTHHQFGIDERDHGNNHSAWWVAQVSAFAHVLGDEETIDFCRKFYKESILPHQTDTLGRFIDELTRTKPYSYSLFNLEAFALICHILSTPDDNLWLYESPEGKSVNKAFEFMYPFIADKSQWPYKPDIAYFNKLPLRGSALLFGAYALQNTEYLILWKSLTADSEIRELIRTFAIRQPVLWM